MTNPLVRRLPVVGPPRPSFRPTLERLEDRLTPAVSFGSPLGFPTGRGPAAVAAADLNGDGRPDLVTVNQTDNTVSVLLDTAGPGATAPSFTLQVTFAVGSFPTSVAVGDFNLDGRPDLAVSNNGDGKVSVLLNATTAGSTVPSFSAQVTFASGATPRAVVAGDFNGDGKPDLAVVNDVGTVSVLLNTATGAGEGLPFFALPKTFPVGSDPYSLAAADFNGDGKADLAVGYFGGSSVSVLLDTASAGATAPAFATMKTFATGNFPVFVTAADLNGDGRPDLVAVNETDNTASVLLDTAADGATAAAFAGQVTFAAGSDPRSVAAADFNGDGRPDLAVANFGSGTVSVLANTTAAGATAASFAAQQTFALGDNPDSVGAADFNGDGLPDLVTANASDNNWPQVRLNTAASFAVTGPPLVADVHGMGVVEYNRLTGQWVQLNPGNPSDVSLLAVDPQGDVFADYAGAGVFRYTPSLGSWRMVVGADAVALAVDARGDLFASFNGAGVGLFRLDGSSQLLTPVTAALLSANANGDLVGDFAGYGVIRRTAFSGMFVKVNGTDALAVAIDAAGDVFASFNGAGVGEFRIDGSASLLTTSAAARLAVDPLGDLTAYVPGQGVMQYRPFVAGRTLLPDFVPASALATDDGGISYADFTGYGVFEYDPLTGWRRLNAADVALLAVS